VTVNDSLKQKKNGFFRSDNGNAFVFSSPVFCFFKLNTRVFLLFFLQFTSVNSNHQPKRLTSLVTKRRIRKKNQVKFSTERERKGKRRKLLRWKWKKILNEEFIRIRNYGQF